MNMKNTLVINGHQAVISYDPDIELFRGEFLHLNGGADFYADSLEGLRQEGEISLKVFLEECAKRNISPQTRYSGKLSLRLSPEMHAKAAHAARAENVSLNEWIGHLIEHA